MPSTLTIVTFLPAAVLPIVVARARRAVSETSLRLAWNWALIAAVALPMVWLSTAVLHLTPSPWDDIVWYGVAILMLCPLIAVLGARRPGVAAWNWFVILPLLAVLGWPAAAVILAGAQPESFSLEAPPLIGMLLVLVMGTGNYAGTRYRLPVAALWSCAVFFIVLPLATRAAFEPQWARLLAVWCGGGAAVTGWRAARRPGIATTGPDRVWRDFRDQFGIVWAHRVRERVNERARQENWPVRLQRGGFVPVDGMKVNLEERTQQRIEHTLRWLLRRFVDDVWIDEKLNTPRETPTAAAPESR